MSLRAPAVSRVWALRLAAIIALGLLSRLVHTGFIVVDKYLGDALYAAMVYAILRNSARPATSAAGALLVMTALELFQLTLIPAHLLANDQLIVRLVARLLGTSFSPLDLLAYAVGIACIWLPDAAVESRRPRSLQ